ncbi:Nudix family hydrolase [Pusillimonas sp. TS35]|uniref:Nudix family hydrolase n=1 Tax=Paracandidimonas lactea TaxID=2895524 RepID=UPI00136DE661|nr:Nudix family hydrolase [Paracandidimonas lactea]MYN12932.1 Nudix family hydrolase [Pusillimonas sp. TS35]
MTKPFVEVAAGLILRHDGAVLLAQRPADKPWPGWWELPGGKLEPGETVLQALARELHEELGIRVTQATPWVTYTHEYSKNIVRLSFCRVTGWEGEPQGLEGQQLAWVDPQAQPLPVQPLLPATHPPMRWAQLPAHYLITSIGHAAALPRYLATLDTALRKGVRLVQFREPGLAANEAQCLDAFRQVLQCCHAHGARCLINSIHPEAWWAEADGVHMRAQDALARAPRHAPTPPPQEAPPGASGRNGHLLGVSAHTAQELQAARALDADFVVVGHVLDTPSHPGVPGIGWPAFAALAQQAALPVYAIGGQSPATLNEARAHGAHGIAGIRGLSACSTPSHPIPHPARQ